MQIERLRRRRLIGRRARIRRGSKRTPVLIVTNERDVGADFLVRELARHGVRVVRCNTERAPQWDLTTLPGSRWSVAEGTRHIDSEQCSGVWWRRPEPPEFTGLELGEEAALKDQWWAFLVALAAVPGPVWVSDPHAVRAAEDKARQLVLAEELGLNVPETVWSNARTEAVNAIGRWGGRAVVKSVTSAWWESEGRGWFVFARLVGVEDLPGPEELASAPLCFQQPIVPKRDIRVTVVGRRAMAAIRGLDSRSADGEQGVDWRRTPDAPWTPCQIPAEIASRCVALTEGLGLKFSGIDLALDDLDRYWFLESNPNGEWGWLQRAGLPIAQTLAEELTS